MDRLAELSMDLSEALERLREEALGRDLRRVLVPLAWLDEANGWLRYELERCTEADPRDPVPFTYVPVHLRK
ncbi:MAG: hypothetical protein WEC75_12910 [Dehalococcoidia bacterium]